MRILRALVALSLVAVICRAQSTLVPDSVYSPALGRTMKMNVILPPSHDGQGRSPVIYLLHGLTGNYTDWATRTKLVEYAAAYPFVIIMPDADDSWYTNSLGNPKDRFEDYIVRDLPAYVEKKYGLDTASRAIAGLSMGGYGALMLAMRHPGMYFFAGDLSGAITIPGSINAFARGRDESPAALNMEKIFGMDSASSFRLDHDVIHMAASLPVDRMPYVYCAVGIQDGFKEFLPAHRRFTALLKERGDAYEYHELPGEHNWKFWDREVRPMLARIEEILHDRKKP